MMLFKLGFFGIEPGKHGYTKLLDEIVIAAHDPEEITRIIQEYSSGVIEVRITKTPYPLNGYE